MDNDFGKIKSKIKLLTDEELVRMLTLERDQYLQDALDYAEDEVKRRGLDINVSRSVKSENKRDLQKKASLSGLGGWLIIVAIGLVSAPIILLIVISSSLSLLSDPLTSSFLIEYPYERYLIFSQIIIKTVFICFFTYTVFYFFKKDRRLPKLFIILASSNAIYHLIDYLMSINIFGLQNYSDFDLVLRSILYAAIWIPYFKKSERVKATFVN